MLSYWSLDRGCGWWPGIDTNDTMLVFSPSVVSDSMTPWTVPTRLLCPWDFPGKILESISFLEYRNTLPSPDLPDPEIKLGLLLVRQTLYHWAAWEAQWHINWKLSTRVDPTSAPQQLLSAMLVLRVSWWSLIHWNSFSPEYLASCYQIALFVQSSNTQHICTALCFFFSPS